MGVSLGRPNACVALCALGSCLNLVWCTLMGHTLGFMPASNGMQDWTNPRTFFFDRHLGAEPFVRSVSPRNAQG